jgi:protein arginine N-methyltransferase 1
VPHPADRPTWRYDNAEAEILDYHLSMLLDEARMGAYQQAIASSVRTGDVVVDIGAGTGILSFLACSAGASKVYAIEGGPVIEVARELCESNGFSDRVVLINEWSTAVDLPEPADVVITETIGNAAIDEGIIAWTIDARRRLLRPGGLVLPQRVGMWTAAVESWDDHAQVSDWSAPTMPVDYGVVRDRAARTLWFADLRKDQVLTEPALVADVDLRAVDDQAVTASGELTVRRDGTLHGLACWFDADLVDGVTLSNSPPTASPSWAQGYLPISQPLAVTTGDVLTWELAVSTDGEDWSWQVSPGESRSLDG